MMEFLCKNETVKVCKIKRTADNTPMSLTRYAIVSAIILNRVTSFIASGNDYGCLTLLSVTCYIKSVARIAAVIIGLFKFQL